MHIEMQIGGEKEKMKDIKIGMEQGKEIDRYRDKGRDSDGDGDGERDRKADTDTCSNSERDRYKDRDGETIEMETQRQRDGGDGKAARIAYLRQVRRYTLSIVMYFRTQWSLTSNAVGAKAPLQ